MNVQASDRIARVIGQRRYGSFGEAEIVGDARKAVSLYYRIEFFPS